MAALLTRGLVREELIESNAKADMALNTLWRNEEDGRGVLLRVTAAGLEALGIEPEVALRPEASQRPGAGGTDSPAAAESLSAATAQGRSASHPTPVRGKTREGTKQAALVAMLQRPKGVTITALRSLRVAWTFGRKIALGAAAGPPHREARFLGRESGGK